MNNSTGQFNGTVDPVHTHDCIIFRLGLYTVLGFFCILGFIGNAISISVLSKDHTSPIARFLLQTISLADNAFLCIWIMQYTIRYYIEYALGGAGNSPAWLYTRVFTFPLLYMAQTETIWLTVVIALNRYMAVCKPYLGARYCNTPITVYREVAVVTAFSILYNLPRYFELKVVETGNGTASWAPANYTANYYYRVIYTDGFYQLFSFILPLIILAYVNINVTLAYRAAQKRKQKMIGRARKETNENNITLVMIIIVLVFMLCLAPARIVQLVTQYKYDHCHETAFYVIHVVNVLEVSYFL
ncbi:unnamed protein product [Dimorphilus gyrociliatus]|nr:unnamed protein product [Dimorphilus gyrociliatus]